MFRWLQLVVLQIISIKVFQLLRVKDTPTYPIGKLKMLKHRYINTFKQGCLLIPEFSIFIMNNLFN